MCFSKLSETYAICRLNGQNALVTGGRVKIGFQVVLKLLRSGACVIVTTRFPNDCARRFAELDDYENIKDKIKIYGLDFRYVPGVERFCEHLCETLPRLDIIINNACQTIRRPPAYYRHLMPIEQMPKKDMPQEWLSVLGVENSKTNALTDESSQQSRAQSGNWKDEIAEMKSMLGINGKTFGSLTAAEMTQIPIFEDTTLRRFRSRSDVNQWQIDTRKHNSWL